MIYNKIKHNVLSIIFFILFLISLIYFVSLLYFSFKPDEDVSIGLIQHSYHEIVNIDSLDVHPPLYYLLLKLFIQLTTFWTKSIFVKTIFARIFSFILLILFLLLMTNIIKKININNRFYSYKWQLILFLIIPGVINESTKIRMYSLGAFLLAAELYELINFDRSKNNKSIILATIFASLASYTFYPLAISSGLFLLLYFVYQFYEHNKQKYIKILISGIIFFILYLPWMPIVFNQMKIHSDDGSLVFNYFNSILASITQLNAPSPFSPLFNYISIASLIVIAFFSFIIIYLFKNIKQRFNNIFIITLINFILTILLSIIFCRRQFRPSISYPIFSILVFLIISIFIFKINYSRPNKVFSLFSLIILFIFIGYMGSATLFNIKGYDASSFELVNNMKKWSKLNNNTIDITNKSKNLPSQSVINQYSIYLQSINKKIIIPNNKYNMRVASNNSFKKYNVGVAAQESFNNSNKYTKILFNKVFNNIYFKNVK